MKSNQLYQSARLFALAVAALSPAGMLPVMAEPVPQSTTAHASTITGTVFDSDGEPAIGASVKCKDPKVQPVVTDIDGNFILRTSSPQTLEISYVGFKTVTVKATPGTPLEVTLQTDNNVLDEMVVVGFATQKRINLTGSVGTASAKDIASRPVQNAAAALQGVIPGLNIGNGSAGGELNASKSVNIRGKSTIGSGVSDSPLILIDGLEGDLNSVNPNDIESISVLKDAASASIYGSRAPFGVILITTKKGSSGKSKISYSNSFRFNKPLTPMKMMDSMQYIYYLNDVARYTSPGTQEFNDDFVEQALAYYNGESDNFIYDNKWATDEETKQSYRRWGTGECGGTFANVNWLDELYKQTAFAQEHNLTLTGGNEKVTYYVSGNYLDQDGFLKYGNDSYERFSLMGRVNAQMFKWLNIQYTGRWMRTDYSRPTVYTGGFYEKVIRRLAPTNPVYDPNGYIAADYNYIEHLENGGRHKEQNDLFTNQFKVVITPLEGWNIIGEFNAKVDNNWNHEDSKIVYAHDADDLEGLSSETVHKAFDSGSHDSVSEYSYRQTYLNLNAYTDYSFKFAEKNDMKVMVGFQSEDYRQRNLSAWRQDMLNPDQPVIHLTSSETQYGLDGYYQKARNVGFFGRINYSFDDKYLAEVNLRYDGTSRFRSNHRWVWSPSASIGWNIDRENFWENLRKVVPALKFRASYGQLSNQNTSLWYPTYRVMEVKANGSNWLVNNALQTIANYPELINPLMTWEKIRTTNIGIDFSLFKYKLTGSFDYFWRDNRDMLGPAAKYPATLGTTAPNENNLSMRTSGWELQIGWQDNVGDFIYSAKLNLSDDRAKVLEYPNAEMLFDTNNMMSIKYMPGEYIGDIYGLTSLGVAKTDEEMQAHLAKVNQDKIGSNWQAGDIMYADIDGDGEITKGTGLNDLGDLKKIGNHQPRYRIGFNLYASWKGIDVSAFFQGVCKRDYYFSPYGKQGTNEKGAAFWGATSGGRWESIFLTSALDYWRDESSALGENRDAYFARPLYYTNKNREFQDRYLQNAAYLRLKNIQIGYTLPQEITRKFFVEKLRIFFSGENLCTWTKLTKALDPESLDVSRMASGSSYPLAKTFSFGLTLDI